MKSGRINRIVKILTTLQSGRVYSAGELATIFDTSRRTIFRDLEELQAIGVPYQYDRPSGGYKVEPEFFLPPVDLNLQEALSLLILAHKGCDQIQLPFKSSALMAVMKIENNLPAKIRQYCGTALQKISVRTGAHSGKGSLDKTFAQLQKAILKKRVVSLKYRSFFEKKIVDIELNPYHLLFNKRAWYVLGFSSLHKSIRTFKLSRIIEMQLTTNKYFASEECFRPDEHLGKAWSMIPEGRIYNIKLRFLPKVAKNVAEVLWHPSQQVALNLDGSATVEFRVDGLQEISWWILGYGDHVEILAPKKLRNSIIKTARNIVYINKGLQ